MDKSEIIFITGMDGVAHNIIPSRIAAYAKGISNDIWYSGGYLMFKDKKTRDEQFDILDKAILASMEKDEVIMIKEEPVKEIVPSASSSDDKSITIGDVAGDVTIH